MPRSADDEALLALARLVTGISTRAADRLGTLSVVQLRALTVIDLLAPANLGQVATDLGVTVSTASRLVNRLVSAGLIDRRPSPHSRRELALTVTGVGRATLAEYDDLRLVDLRERLAGVADPDAVLAAFREFTAAGPVPSPGSAAVR